MDSGAIKLIFSALANPIRLDILHALYHGEKNVTELVRELRRDQSLVSHNLKRLVASKLIRSRKEGQFRYYSLHQGSVAPLLRNIEELKKFMVSKSDEVRRQTQARYDQIVRMTPAALFIQKNGAVTFANRAGLKLLAAKKESDIIGRSFEGLTSPECRVEIKKRYMAMADGRKLKAYETRIVRLDGRVIDVLANEEPLQDGSNNSCIAVLVDITEQKEIERRLAADQNLIRMALSATRAVAWRWDIKTNRVEMLGDAIGVLGARPTTSQAIWALLHLDDLPVMRGDFEASMTKPRASYVRRCRIIRPDTREVKWVELHSFGFYENGVKTLVVGMAIEVEGK
ncbi:MAG: metalloregulator ArsR/SmtB family transcription factor [Patescibacteria group bacterium]